MDQLCLWGRVVHVVTRVSKCGFVYFYSSLFLDTRVHGLLFVFYFDFLNWVDRECC